MPDRQPRGRRGRKDPLGRLDAIREAGDRRESFALLRHLLSGRLDEQRVADVAECLLALEDPRCAPALREAVLDARRSAAVRASALEILAAAPCDDPPRDLARAWAQDHDPLVRALGLQYLDVPDAGLIAAAAADPEPVVRRLAVESMASIVRTAPLVAALRRALRDDDDHVREVACRVALFDEPLEASWELLRALSDPSAVVRSAAYDALEWYPRVSVLLALADARASADDAAPANDVLDVLAARICDAMRGASAGARRRLERWAGPVAWLVEAPRRGTPPGSAPRAGGEAAPPERNAPAGGAPPARIDVGEAERVLLDPGAPATRQRELLQRRSWTRSGGRGLEVLRFCAASSNWSLRQCAARPLAGVRAVEELLVLCGDREPVVRRAAFIAALEVPDLEDRRFLDAARAALADPAMRPTTGDHALALVALLSRPRDVEETVIRELSREDDRDGLYLGATHLARMAGLRGAVPALLSVVHAPVVASVAPHVSALQALRSLGHPRKRIDLSHLDGVDHLDVQAELGEWGWHGPRWG